MSGVEWGGGVAVVVVVLLLREATTARFRRRDGGACLRLASRLAPRLPGARRLLASGSPLPTPVPICVCVSPPPPPTCRRLRSLRQKLEKQLQIIKKRSEGLIMKASEVNADNMAIRLAIDDLRSG